MSFEHRIRTLGLELPRPSTPGANYVPFARHGDLVYLTGQLCQWNGECRFVGKLGREFEVESGQQAARLCALNLIAQLRSAMLQRTHRMLPALTFDKGILHLDAFAK